MADGELPRCRYCFSGGTCSMPILAIDETIAHALAVETAIFAEAFAPWMRALFGFLFRQAIVSPLGAAFNPPSLRFFWRTSLATTLNELSSKPMGIRLQPRGLWDCRATKPSQTGLRDTKSAAWQQAYGSRPNSDVFDVMRQRITKPRHAETPCSSS